MSAIRFFLSLRCLFPSSWNGKAENLQDKGTKYDAGLAQVALGLASVCKGTAVSGVLIELLFHGTLPNTVAIVHSHADERREPEDGEKSVNDKEGIGIGEFDCS